jgi:gliding motility-associated-like protein
MTSSQTSPTFTLPPSSTPYTVQLIATNQQGCRDSLTKANYIRVIPRPVGDFYINPAATISIPDYTFSFTNLTLNSILYQYTWSLGDGTFANTRDVPDHLYADTGSYPIQMIVLDTSTNCSDTTIKIARIQGYPGYLYVPNAFYPNSIRTEFKSFKPVGKGLAEYELQIFDSWGKLLFKSNKLDANGIPVEGWDGTFKGQPMPQDGYAWYIKAVFRNGQKWSGMKYNQKENGSRGHTFGTITLFR